MVGFCWSFSSTIRLKETIEKQKKDHQDAMSDIERAALQAKERLKKEMAMRIEETKTQMLKQMDDQLHAVYYHLYKWRLSRCHSICD